MNQGRLRRIFILLVATAICLEMARFSQMRYGLGSRPLTMWFSETDLAKPVMDELLLRCLKQSGLRIEALCYPDEASLGLALEESRPDLLFCSQSRAAQLYERGGLASLSQGLPVPEVLEGAEPAVGRAFFPVGGQVPLLLQNTALSDKAPVSMEELLGRRESTLTADSLADILYAEMLSVGKPMLGDTARDEQDADYLRFYNALALSAFQGTLLPAERNAAEYVLQGMLPFAIVPSPELALVHGQDLRITPLPLPNGGAAVYPVQLVGFVLPEGSDTVTARAFLRWLWSDGGAGETAYAAGLVPVTAARDASGKGGLEGLLCSLSMSGQLRIASGDEAYYQNRAQCERSVRQALDLLT